MKTGEVNGEATAVPSQPLAEVQEPVACLSKIAEIAQQNGLYPEFEKQAVRGLQLTEERERAALLCEDLAVLMENGAGDPEPGGRLRQAARNIREGKRPAGYAKSFAAAHGISSSATGGDGRTE